MRWTRSTQFKVFAGCNVSDQPKRWKRNYRCPDVAVFLPGNPAEDRKTHWFGGPDFAVEIISRFDRSREKFGFYKSVGVRELLLVDRHPWALELYRADARTGSLSVEPTVRRPASDLQRSLAPDVPARSGHRPPPDRDRSADTRERMAGLAPALQ